MPWGYFLIIDEINFDLFSKGFTQKSNAYEEIRTKFKMTKQRLWNMFDIGEMWRKMANCA